MAFQLLERFSDRHFWRQYYLYFFVGLGVLFFILMLVICIVWYEVWHRPLPLFRAINPLRQSMRLTPFEAPNLLPDTLLRFASKATVAAYTFDFVNYESEFAAARQYFTDAGWSDFKNAIQKTLNTVIQNQLFVTGVVTDTPIIVNQGELPERGYVYRVQIPFLVAYQSANTVTKANYVVVLSIVHVPTSKNPQGIGIDQFIMVSGGYGT